MIVFIIGCARSGTSILGELMGSHHEVFYLGEKMQPIWHSFSIAKHHKLTEEDIAPSYINEIKDCFMDYERRCVVEKCPPNILRIPFIHGIFPEARFIHIIRDGRDVACSLVPGLTDSWQHLKPPGWELTNVLYKNDALKKGAWLWENVLHLGLKSLSKISHLQIRYEDLVRDPLGIAKQVFAYLEMTIDPNVMAFSSKIQNHTKGSYQAKGQDYWFRDDHEVRVGRWRENIPEDQVEEIEAICQPLLARLGYD